MKIRTIVIAAALLWAVAPSPARADGFVSPFIGANFGGDLGDLADSSDSSKAKLNFGVAAGWMGAGIIGVEVDLSHSPDFFKATDTASGLEIDGNLTTLMANLIVGAPIGGMGRGARPYASGGIGVIRSNVHDAGDFFDISSSDFALDLGGGVMGFFTDNVGVRGDIRYFRSLEDPEPDDEFDISFGKFDFWRGTIGVAFRF